MSNLKDVRNLLNALYYNEKQTESKEFAPLYIRQHFNLFIKLMDKYIGNMQKELQNPNPKPWELLDDDKVYKLAKGLKNARRNIWEYLEKEGEHDENTNMNN